MRRTSVKILVILPLLLGLFGVFSPAGHAQSRKEKQRAEKLMETAETASRQKNYAEAARKYEEALAIWPTNAEARYKKGIAHHFLGEYDKSVIELDAAQRNGYKPLIEVWRARSEAYDKLKRYDDALADMNRILAVEPGNFRFQLAVADIHYNKGAYKEAADAISKAIPKAPNSADLYYRLADAKSNLGDIDGQAAAADEAVKRNTQFLADALILLGNARYAQKRIPEATDAFSRALASRPDKLESYIRLAELYRRQNQIKEGLKTLEDAKSRNATNGEVYKYLSLFYSLAERNEDAVITGTSATQLLPNDPDAHANLCRAYQQSKKFDSAVAACNAALRLAPDHGEAMFYLGRAQVDLNRKADADKNFKKALVKFEAFTKERPEDADGFYMLGNVYADMGQNANAIETYKKALELNPKLTRIHFNIGVIELNKNNKPGALEQYNALLPVDKVLAERLKGYIDKM